LSLGNFFAGIISGNVYQAVADKITFMRKELIGLGYDVQEVKNMSETMLSQTLCEIKGLNPNTLTEWLWDKYHPYDYWILLFSIGMFAVVSLWIYYTKLIKK